MGMWKCWGFLVVGLLVFVVRGAEGYPAEDFVDGLPGQPKVEFRQYAGYVTVDAAAGRSLFYYFVEATGDADKKPLTLWLSGGPGCSSVGGGAFTELGPFYPRGDARGLRVNKKSWNRVSNLLFVESPAGVGWSYSNTTSDYTTGDARTAHDMHEFLMRWYNKFPEFKSRGLFLTGESYAGHYIPQLANVLLNHNEHSTGFKFNLKGVAIGNPLLKPNRDGPATYDFYWSHGMISDELSQTIKKRCDFEHYTFSSTHNVSDSCIEALNEADYNSNFVDAYDVILDVCYPSIAEQAFRLRKLLTKKSMGVDVCMSHERLFYFNLPEVQRALHANTTSLPYNWSMCSEVLEYNQDDGDINIVPLLKNILNNGIPLSVFSGDQDSVLPVSGTRRIVRELAEDLKFPVTVPYIPWFNNQQVGGWMTEYGNILTYATVRGASHMVPYAQPDRALTLFKSFVKGLRLPDTATEIPGDAGA